MTFSDSQNKADAAMQKIMSALPNNHILRPSCFRMNKTQQMVCESALDRYQMVTVDYREIAETEDLVPLLTSRVIMSHLNAIDELAKNIEQLEKLEKEYQPKQENPNG